MGKNTLISWTDHTFSPWWGCLIVSPGCEHCYAKTFSERLGMTLWGPAKNTPRRTFGDKHWTEPLRWNARAAHLGVRKKVFCASMADVFEDHPTCNAERPKLWKLIRATPWLDWQILTKRPENIAHMLPDDWDNGYANVWLGTSVESQDYVERISLLCTVPAAIRFVSCEPLLGPLNLHEPFEIARLAVTRQYVRSGWDPGIQWVIVGGESGAHARALDLDAVASIHEQCAAAGIAFFMKQDSGRKSGLRGRIPDDLWVQEFPRAALP